jgi:hypothetical protein
MKVYVASSSSNPHYLAVIERLRLDFHSVYDFRNPPNGAGSFAWSQIDPAWESWSPSDFRDALDHPRARQHFHSDMGALRSADAVVLVLPCNRSAHLELGYAVGAGKITIVYDPTQGERAELMYLMCDSIVDRLDDVAAIIERERRFIA